MTADEMNENGEGWRDLIAQWCCVPIPMLSPRLFVIIVHVVNIVRNSGKTEPQERRIRTAREYHETINHNTYNTMNNPTLLKNLRCIPDFPKPGIQFQDVTTLFKNAECLRIMRDEIVDMYRDKGITKIVGIESRGFMLAGVVAAELGAGVVMCRKPGKLPGETIKESYMKE